MKKIVLLFILSTSIISVHARTNLDSLQMVWMDHNLADTSRLAAIDKMIWDKYMKSNPDTALYLANLQYDFAKVAGLKNYMAKSFIAQGEYWKKNKKYEKALDCLNQSLALNEEIDDKKGIASSLSKLASILYNQGEYQQAISYYSQVIEIRKEINDKSSLAGTYNNVARLYSNQGYNSKALEYFNLSLKINEELNNRKWMAKNLNNIGSIYSQDEEYEKALKYYSQSLKIKEELGLKKGVATSLGNIGVAYTYQGEYAQALDYYYRSLKTHEEIGSEHGSMITKYNIGRNFYYQKEYNDALNYFNQAFEISKKLNSKLGKAKMMNSIGDIQLKQNLEKEAILWCEGGLEISDEIGAIPEQIEACKCLYEAYKSLEKGNDALLYLERVKSLEDSISKEETWKKLQEMEFTKQIQIEKAEREKEEQRSRSRLWIIILIALGATITPTILYYYFKQRIRLQTEKAKSHLSDRLLAEEKLKTQNQEKQLLDLELEHKKKDLADMALSLSQKKQQAEELYSQVIRVEKSRGKQRQKELRSLKEELQNQQYVDKELEHLQQNIDVLSSEFYDKLQKSFPELSKTEIKLSSFIKLNLSTSQIAQLQNITPKSVKMSRYRLRKKLELDPDQNLDEFLQSF